MKKQKAFTLAEVLTTLMVIGVVAALTIPSMMNSYKKHTTVVKVKKVYSQIQQVLKLIYLDAGCSYMDVECVGLFDYEDKNDVTGGFAEKFLKHCKGGRLLSAEECTSGEKGVCIINPDGTAIILDFRYHNLYGINPANIYVDINGLRSPNEYGKDKFHFHIATHTKNGISIGTFFPMGSYQYSVWSGNKTAYWNSNEGNCKEGKVNRLCTGRLIDEGKITYY